MIEMQRMKLRAYVNLQARSSPGSGPCGQFLLEPFAGVGSPELRGGCQAFQTGRIRACHVDAVLKPLASDCAVL